MRKKKLIIFITIIILIFLGIVVIYFNLPDRFYEVYQETEIKNGNTQNKSKPSDDLVYIEYDGEIVNIEETATIYVAVSGAEDINDIVVVLINCNTGKRIERNYTENLYFEDVGFGTYAVYAYRTEEDKYTEVDIMVDITYDLKKKDNVIQL